MFALVKRKNAHHEFVCQPGVEIGRHTIQPRYGTGRRPVSTLSLALMLGLHLALVLLWASSKRGHADHSTEPRRFTLTWLQPMKPRATPPPAPAPTVPPRATRPPAMPAASLPRPAPESAAPPVSVPPDMPAPGTVPSGAPDAPAVASMIDAAKRQAGAIDRELRNGKAAPLASQPDHPMARYRVALESAYIDRSRTVRTEVLTQPDGVIVYRFRLGGKVWCRQSGGSGPSMLERSEGARLAGAGSAGGAGVAGNIQCPGGDATWRPL